MTQTIREYTLKPECSIEMSKDASILSVHERYGEVCLWALIDPDQSAESYETRHFHVYGTGHHIPKRVYSGDFIGTVFLGSLVFHVFEVFP